MSFKIHHDMQGSLHEILRALLEAISHLNFELHGDTVTVRDHGKRISIDLHYEGERHIGLWNLPMTGVTYEFVGYTEEEKDAFMKHLQLHMQRCGQ